MSENPEITATRAQWPPNMLPTAPRPTFKDGTRDSRAGKIRKLRILVTTDNDSFARIAVPFLLTTGSDGVYIDRFVEREVLLAESALAPHFIDLADQGQLPLILAVARVPGVTRVIFAQNVIFLTLWRTHPLDAIIDEVIDLFALATGTSADDFDFSLEYSAADPTAADASDEEDEDDEDEDQNPEEFA